MRTEHCEEGFEQMSLDTKSKGSKCSVGARGHNKKGVGKGLIGPVWIHFLGAWFFIPHGIRFLLLTFLVNSFFGTIRSYHRYHAYRTLWLMEKVNFKRLDSD